MVAKEKVMRYISECYDFQVKFNRSKRKLRGMDYYQEIMEIKESIFPGFNDNPELVKHLASIFLNLEAFTDNTFNL